MKILALSAASLLATAGVAMAGLHVWARALGIRDASFRYENEIGMWAPDAEIGFVNAPDFDAWVFGNVRVRTDARGFRRPAEDAGPQRGPLLVGFGDSVMWGTSVNEEDSFLGLLRRRLSGRYRVVNAGVVGYASLQEQRFFTGRVLPLAPEIAVLNFCHNDLLPTEDPFDNARRIYVAYLRGLQEQARADVADDIGRLIRILRKAPVVWKRLETAPGPLRDLARELLIERPLLELSRQARENGVRLIVVFIPSRRPDALELRLAGRVRTLLEEAGVETLDLYGALSAVGQGTPPRRTALPSWLRIPVLERIATLRRLERIQQTRVFIDTVHPTRRGNALIADALEGRIAGPALRSGR